LRRHSTSMSRLLRGGPGVRSRRNALRGCQLANLPFYQAAHAGTVHAGQSTGLGRINNLAPITFSREQQTSGVLVRHVLLADGFDGKLLHDLAIAHHRDPLA
jgi:hypothetical protein